MKPASVCLGSPGDTTGDSLPRGGRGRDDGSDSGSELAQHWGGYRRLIGG